MNSKQQKGKNPFSGLKTLSRRKNGSQGKSSAAVSAKSPHRQSNAPQQNTTDETSLKAALEKIQLPAVMLNLYGEITYCNDYLLTLAGRKARETAEKNWFDLFIPSPRREELRIFYLQNILSGAYPSQSNYEIQSAFGTTHFISWTHSPLRDEKGRTTGLFSIGTEVDIEEMGPQEREETKETAFALQTGIQEAVPSESSQEPPVSPAPPAASEENPGIEAKTGEFRKSAETAETAVIGRAGKYLTFLLNGEEFGVGIGEVKEIIGLVPVRPLPRSPAYIKGVINLRGRMIPVIDLRLRFGLEKTDPTSKTCIVILEIKGASAPLRIGAIVDCVLEVLRIKEEEIEDAPSFGAAVNTEYILGMAKSNGKVKILLDMKEVLGSEFVSSPEKLNGFSRPANNMMRNR